MLSPAIGPCSGLMWPNRFEHEGRPATGWRTPRINDVKVAPENVTALRPPGRAGHALNELLVAAHPVHRPESAIASPLDTPLQHARTERSILIRVASP